MPKWRLALWAGVACFGLSGVSAFAQGESSGVGGGFSLRHSFGADRGVTVHPWVQGESGRSEGNWSAGTSGGISSDSSGAISGSPGPGQVNSWGAGGNSGLAKGQGKK
jgi:hypothetical protein